MEQIDIAPGDKVNYKRTPETDDRFSENGIVKEVISTTQVRVVYNCNYDWNNYKDYTSALTHIRNLTVGWKDNARNV